MLKEAIDRIVALANPPKLHIVDGRTYVDGALSLVVPPRPAGFEVATLTGLRDVLAAMLGDRSSEWLVEVCTPTKVIVLSMMADVAGQRARLVDCELKGGDGFRFNQFLDRESFVIGLQSQFVETPELSALLKLSSSMSNEGVTLSEDDGISQKTTFKQEIWLVNRQAVNARWTLQPFRTFREIEQPASQFILRLRGEPGQVPQCALYEADGGKWKLDAMLAVRAWLQQAGLPVPVVA